MAGVLDQRLGRLGPESDERAFLELMTSGIREVARRLEQTEVALAAYLPAPQAVGPALPDLRLYRSVPSAGAEGR
jgi:hypothetical protein